jgi:malonyl-CoA O-methyltransferase
VLAYDRWAGMYPPRPHNALMEAEQAAMLELLPDVTGRAALDAGCGTGRYARLLHARGAHVVGVDFSEAMLRLARGAGARLVRADLRAMPLRSSSFDVVVSGLALHDIADLPGALAELARVLRTGGQLVYSVVHPIGARLGWARTFGEGGRRWAVETSWHSVEAHAAALAAAGLMHTGQREPLLPQPDGTRCPAVLVLRALRRP